MDRLRRDGELDRTPPLAELDELREAAGAEGRERDSILDPLVVGGASRLDRDGLRENLRLCRESLELHSELSVAALRQACLRGEPFGQPRYRRLEQLQRALRCSRQHGDEGDADEVERGRQWERIEVSDRDD